MADDFSTKVVMITGASGNLGGAVARAFRAAGASLGLIDRSPGAAARVFPDLAGDPEWLLPTTADLTSAGDVSRAVGQVLDRFGRVDVLVHTVGGYRAGTPLHETPVDTLEFMLNLNAKTLFVTNQAVLSHMVRQGSGKIINVAARPGLAGAANMAAYSAAKAAVIRLTESAADEVKGRGVNVNCVVPGTIDTPQNRQATPDADVGKWVTPESLAGVIMFLASDAARDIHGAAIPVYGLT